MAEALPAGRPRAVPWGHVLRRARAQRGLLAVVLLVAVLGTALLGTCGLLIASGQRPALVAALTSAPEADLLVTADLALPSGTGGSAGANAAEPAAETPADPAAGPVGPAAVVGTASEVLAAQLATPGAVTSAWWTSRARALTPGDAAPAGGAAGGGGIARAVYLGGGDDLLARSRLVEGAWPQGDPGPQPWPVALPVAAAERLGAGLGDRLELGTVVGTAITAGEAADPVAVVVVATFEPLPGDPAWSRDPLGGAGHGADEPGAGGLYERPVLGPLVLSPQALAASADDPALADVVEEVALTARPDLTAAAPAAPRVVVAGVRGAQDALEVALGPAADAVRVRSALPAVLAGDLAQQRVTRSAVLALALVGAVLAATTLALAGQLVTGRRAEESALLVARGASRGQLLAAAAAEAVALSVLAGALAVPLAVLAHRALASGAVRRWSGTVVPEVSSAAWPALAAAALAGGAVLTAALVAPLLRAGDRPAARSPWRGGAARSGADLLLVALAAVALWQLRSGTGAGGGGGGTGGAAGVDPVLASAPVLGLLAGSLLVLRVVSWLRRGADARAVRSRGLVVALAGWEVARRPRATGAALLLALAAATTTAGVSVHQTWMASQRDQAALGVGTDLVVTPVAAGSGAAGARSAGAQPAGALGPLLAGPALGAATGGALTPVTDRAIAVGSRVIGAGGGPAPRLLALDTATAGAVLRGRAPGGRSWGGVVADLRPLTPAAGVVLAEGTSQLVLTGTAPGAGAGFTAAVVVVVQDATGTRLPVVAEGAAPLDGAPHPLAITLPAAPAAGGGGTGPGRWTAVALDVRLVPDGPVPDTGPGSTLQRVVDLEVLAPGGTPTADASAVAPAPAPEGAGAGAGGGWAAGPSAGTTATITGATATAAATAATTAATTGDGAATGDAGGSGAVVSASFTAVLTPSLGPTDVVLTAFGRDRALPVVVTTELADELGAAPGDQVDLVVALAPVAAVVVGVVDHLPSVLDASGVLADQDLLSRSLLAQGVLDPVTDRWWVGDPAPGAAQRVADAGLGATTARTDVAAQLLGGPLRGGLPAAAAVLVAAACLLALAGTALHGAAVVRSRAPEIARLTAVGVSRPVLVGSLLLQHAAVGVVALVGGAGVGAVLAALAGPLLVVSDTGTRPVPMPLTVWPWPVQAGLLGVLLVGSLLVLLPVVTALVRRADAAHLRVGGA